MHISTEVSVTNVQQSGAGFAQSGSVVCDPGFPVHITLIGACRLNRYTEPSESCR